VVWDTEHVGEEPPVHIEAEVTMDEDVVAAGQGAPGLVASERRVVREPGRWSRLIAVAVVVGLVAGGLLWWAGAGWPGDDGGEEPRSGSAGDGRPTRVAFRQALTRLPQFGSFAYSGDVHAVGQSAFRPGDGIALDVRVEGAVLLNHGLTREVAVDPMGRAGETVTSGPTMWTRSTTTAEGLGAEPWEVREPAGSISLGMAAVAPLVVSATDPREEPPDPDGRRVIRGTMPAADRQDGDDDLLASADLVVTLDEDGNIARMIVSSTPVDPRLRLELDITRLGEPQAIAPPDDGETGLRRTIPVEELEAAGVRPLELGRVPAGWKLTGAGVVSGPASGGCPRLLLSYRDPNAVRRDSLRLTVMSTTCPWAQLGHGEPQPLAVGSFQGLVVEAGSDTSGDLADGTTRVSFLTDLSTEDAATVLGSLRPFDPDTEPAPIPGIPST
jgi:hypothetical protein